MTDHVRPLIKNAARIAILGQLVESFDTQHERNELIEGLFACGAIKDSTAGMLREVYGREIA